MCYSKEVSLITGLIILASCAYLYYKYVHKQSKTHLKPFFQNVLFGFLCIGFHQFSKFVAISTGSELIYKIGLIVSISAMYFFMQSLQKLTHYSFYGHSVVLSSWRDLALQHRFVSDSRAWRHRCATARRPVNFRLSEARQYQLASQGGRVHGHSD